MEKILGVQAMGRRINKKRAELLTPEQVIRYRRQRLAERQEVKSFITKAISMILLLVLIFGILFGVTPMRNNDMSPRLSAGDLMIYYRLEKTIHLQDIVVFEKDGRQYAGRIVARGGDSVEITDDSRLKVNNSLVVETGIFYKTPIYGDEVAYPLTLAADQYFILCDYRNGARDSRYFGAVSRDEIKGKVITVIRRSSL